MADIRLREAAESLGPLRAALAALREAWRERNYDPDQPRLWENLYKENLRSRGADPPNQTKCSRLVCQDGLSKESGWEVMDQSDSPTSAVKLAGFVLSDAPRLWPTMEEMIARGGRSFSP